MLLPVLCLPEAQEGKVMVSGSGAFRTGSGAVQRLTENETEAFLLLTGTPGKRTFWLQGKRVTIRRCTVSVALRKQMATLRLDCQTAYGTPQPDAGTVSTVGRALPWGGTFLLAAGDRPAASAGAQSAAHRLSRRV